MEKSHIKQQTKLEGTNYGKNFSFLKENIIVPKQKVKRNIFNQRPSLRFHIAYFALNAEDV